MPRPIRDRDGRDRRRRLHVQDVTARYRGEANRQLPRRGVQPSWRSSLDYEETLRRVAELAVPGFADWCSVDLAAADGTLDRLVVAHADPAKVELVRELRERYPPNPDAPQGAYAVMRTGKPELVEEIPPAMLDRIQDPERDGSSTN